MPKYLIITRIPRRQDMLGLIPESVLVEEYMIDDDRKNLYDSMINGLYIPVGGVCMVVDVEDVTFVTSKMVNEIKRTIS